MSIFNKVDAGCCEEDDRLSETELTITIVGAQKVGKSVLLTP